MLHAPIAAAFLALVPPGDPPAGGEPPPPPRAEPEWVDFALPTGLWGRPRDAYGFELGAAAAWRTPAAREPFEMSAASAVATGVVAGALGGMLAFGVTALVREDWDGMWMFAKSVAVSTATVHAIKASVDKWRPNGSNTASFPSGHTQASTTGSAFLDVRYGHDYGIPAYLVAVYTGASRVISQNHFADDVISGASIALLANWYFVSPIDSDLSVSPMFTDSGYGVSVQIAPGPAGDGPRGVAEAARGLPPALPLRLGLRLGLDRGELRPGASRSSRRASPKTSSSRANPLRPGERSQPVTSSTTSTPATSTSSCPGARST